MDNYLIHTPEGVRDIYGEEYSRKLKVEELLHQTVASFGYRDIQTPSFEFFDIFSSQIGTTPSRELYKFFDKEGNTLVLRPDFTPSMVRCAVKYFTDADMPLRLCYAGNTFTNTSDLQGKLKEVTQMGAELMGEASAQADAEMIGMVAKALLNTGLKEFQVSIGQVEYFKGICEAAGLNDETEQTLREFISHKNYFGAEALLSSQGVPERFSRVLLRMTELFGGRECLKEAGALADNERSVRAIRGLEELYELLCAYGIKDYVSFDLGMLNNYNYYTGVIFRVYTYGVGEAVAKGGRYDTLPGRFGKRMPAIGFVAVVDQLMNALSRQNVPVDTSRDSFLLVYEKEAFFGALRAAESLRERGTIVELMPAAGRKEPEALSALALARAHRAALYMKDSDTVESVCASDGRSFCKSLKEFMKAAGGPE